MNIWKNHKLSFLLVASSLLLLLLFQVFWLNNIYQNEKKVVREKADLVFEDAVRNVEDSLLQVLILDAPAFGNTQIKINASVLSDKKEEAKEVLQQLLPPHASTSPDKNTAAPQKETRGIQTDSIIKVSLNLRTDFSQNQDDDKKFGSIVLMMANDSSAHFYKDSIFESTNNFTLLQTQLEQSMRQSELPSPYKIVHLENKTLPKGDLYSHPHTNILNQKTYAIFFPNYKKYIFQKILPQLLFSAFLFGVILFSFLVVWKSLEKQRQLTALKNDFISNVTHELKTPITTVGVALEALSNFDVLHNPTRTEEYLDISKHELQRLSLLVDKVLKMSLFEKKEPELLVENIDMQTLVEDVLRSMKLQFEKFSAQVKFNMEGSNFFIKGDKIHLTNVVYNLIDNALKYSKKNPEITLSLKQRNDQLQLVIQDKGIGIQQDLKTKIFEKFFRVPQGDQHDVKGYGLGLSYVASVIKKHHGNIQVNTQIHQGTAFTISLPKDYE
ncbi:MAG TPA: HAMP domain-containing histidine kinase [Phaeodactylibacter sp.]|nr:HAMP domain-containing histidine kinase [Phaeodactylibacter sp.]